MKGSRDRLALLAAVIGAVLAAVFVLGAAGAPGEHGADVFAVAAVLVGVGVLVAVFSPRNEDSGRARPGSGLGRTLSAGWHIIRRGAVPDRSALAAGAGWRLMRLAARLMPPAAGRRWLAEAESFLAEAPRVLQRGAIRSYLAGVPQVIAVSWASELARRARVTSDDPR
jgi:hypothetical protein